MTVPVNIPHLIDANQRRWLAMHFTTSRIPEFNVAAKTLLAHKAQYQEIEKDTGVPWFVIAEIHWRESTANFATQLAQGDPLNQRSIHKPAGEGPYTDHGGHSAFYWAARVALDETGATAWKDWSPGGALTFMEKYNGLGYVERGLASPYIWGGTSEQQAGKYVSDGVWSSTEWDTQLGVAGLIRYMAGLDPTIAFGKPITAPIPVPVPKPVPVPVPVPTPVPPMTTPAAPQIDFGALFTQFAPLLTPLIPIVMGAFPLTAPFVPLVQVGLGAVTKAAPTGGVAATPPATMQDLIATGMYDIAIALKPSLPHTT